MISTNEESPDGMTTTKWKNWAVQMDQISRTYTESNVGLRLVILIFLSLDWINPSGKTDRQNSQERNTKKKNPKPKK
jgi:hypothetical protein